MVEHTDTITLDIPKGHDHSKSKPGLHLFYIERATRHLGIVDRAIRKLYNEANTNASDFAMALQAVRDSKVKHDAAYAQAHKLLRLAKGERVDNPLPGDQDGTIAESSK